MAGCERCRATCKSWGALPAVFHNHKWCVHTRFKTLPLAVGTSVPWWCAPYRRQALKNVLAQVNNVKKTLHAVLTKQQGDAAATFRGEGGAGAARRLSKNTYIYITIYNNEKIIINTHTEMGNETVQMTACNFAS